MSEETKAAWKIWVQNPCFKELLGIITDIQDGSVKDEDSVPTAELNVAVTAQSRGIRSGLKSLLRRIEDKLDESI